MSTSKTLYLRLLSLICIVLHLNACGETSDSNNTPSGSNKFAGEVIERENDWLEIRPGGETICSRGTDYAYFVRPGKTDKVLVEFQGGGACWNTLTCSVAGAIFSEDIENTRAAVGLYQEGIYDHTNPDNPFQNWTHVFVPYCTGDVHWGNSVETYGSGNSQFQIQHKGYQNALAAMSWITSEISSPEKIAVTGCSAGGYGSLVWGAWLMETFPQSHVIQFSDSAAGIITDNFFADSFPRWGVDNAFPAWIPELDLKQNNYLDLDLAKVYRIIGTHYPSNIVAQYNTISDSTQVSYFQAMNGGDADLWSSSMKESINQIITTTPNFGAFIASGSRHCIIPGDEMYDLEVDSVRFVDWVDDLVSGNKSENVYCDECDGFINP